jgi:hypothetical protein
MRIGTIRWDAYYETKEPQSPSSQVARALSPREYHNRAPFFSRVTSEGNIVFDAYTKETWEMEANYAIDWAYCWYRDDDPLSTARKYHVQSKKHDEIQMCGILGVNRMDDITMQQLYQAMQEDYYLKTDGGNPIVYVFNGYNSLDKEGIANLRLEAGKAGVEKPLFISVMMPVNNIDRCKKIAECGYDAVSFYCYFATSVAMPYAELAKNTEARNKTVAQYCTETNLKIIPSFSAGSATEPRIDNPVSWTQGYEKYAQLGTPAEIAQHAANVIGWAKEHTELIGANAVISYAWNEHDEGGWLCPTLLADENGNQIFDNNGKPRGNTSILDAVKEVFKAV